MKAIVLFTLLSLLIGEICMNANEDIEIVIEQRPLIIRMRERFGDFGRTELPVIGQLKDLLPFAMVGYCFNEYPKQTMVALTGLLLYVLFNNETVRKVLRVGKATKDSTKPNQETLLEEEIELGEEDLFDFEEENEFGDEYTPIFKNSADKNESVKIEKKIVANADLKFL